MTGSFVARARRRKRPAPQRPRGGTRTNRLLRSTALWLTLADLTLNSGASPLALDTGSKAVARKPVWPWSRLQAKRSTCQTPRQCNSVRLATAGNGLCRPTGRPTSAGRVRPLDRWQSLPVQRAHSAAFLEYWVFGIGDCVGIAARGGPRAKMLPENRRLARRLAVQPPAGIFGQV